jgi:peptidyl-prolyl cis-trans isomerase A (cyclophilin A)
MEEFKVSFETSKGSFIVKVDPSAAPKGAARFHELVTEGLYNDCRFFRVIAGFMCQFGINGDPEVSAQWRDKHIDDDPVVESNVRGAITFAMSGPDSRTSQLFINFGDNTNLDGMGFSPFGQVIEGMDVVDSLYSEYGEGAPGGDGPEQGRLQTEGNAYLIEDFPEMDHIIEAKVLEES